MCTSPSPEGRRAAALVAVLLLSACTVGPDFHGLQRPGGEDAYGPVPGAIRLADGSVQHLDAGAAVDPQWWRAFGSPELDRLVAQALEGNPGIASAQARLGQAQAYLEAARGALYPQVDATAGAGRQRSDLAHLGEAGQGPQFNLYSVGAGFAYVLDVFGAQRRAIEGAQAQVDVQRAVFAGTRLAVAGYAAGAVIARAASQAQLREASAVARLQRERLALLEVQYQAGVRAYGDVLAARADLAAAEAVEPGLAQRADQAAHLLAILAGATPGGLADTGPAFEALQLPTRLPVTLPAQLVHQRPDVAAAQAQAHAASAAVGVAAAAQLPGFEIDASYGQAANTTRGLLERSGAFWSLGVNALAPVFHGGTLSARRRAAEAAWRGSMADYRQVVLGAFAQVADTLRALQHDAQLQEARDQHLEAAQTNAGLVAAAREAGLAGDVEWLAARIQAHQAQLEHIDALSQRLQDAVALFGAAGGGWSDGGQAASREAPGR